MPGTPDDDNPPDPEPGPATAPQSLRRTATRGLGTAGGGYVASQVIMFLSYLVLVRLLTPRDFGIYAAGTLITGIGGLFAESGMGAALITRTDRLDEAASTAFASGALAGLGLMLGSLALSPLLGLAFHSIEVRNVTAVLSGWLLLGGIGTTPEALLQRSFSFVRRMILDPLAMIAYAAVSIALAAAGAGVWAMVAGAYAAMIVRVAGSWIASGFRPRWSLISFAMWRELASFARPLVASEIFRRVSAQIDTFMLGRFSGTAALGQYRNGMKLAQQPAATFVSVASYVILPVFARISSSSHRLAAGARLAFEMTSVVIVPVSVACLPLGVPLAVIVMGDRWHQAGVVIAGLGGFVLGTTLLAIATELMKAMRALQLQLVVQVMTLGLIAVTVTVTSLVWGPLGVAVAVSFSSCVPAVYAMIRIATKLSMPPLALCSSLLTPALASAPMVAAMLAFDHGVGLLGHREALRVVLLAAEIAIGAVVYGSVLGTIDRRRRAQGVEILRRAWARVHPTPAPPDPASAP